MGGDWITPPAISKHATTGPARPTAQRDCDVAFMLRHNPDHRIMAALKMHGIQVIQRDRIKLRFKQRRPRSSKQQTKQVTGKDLHAAFLKLPLARQLQVTRGL